MLFIFGFGTKQKMLGEGGVRTCPRCHNATAWSRIRRYRQFTIFFVPIARWGRTQLEICGICGASVPA